MKPKSVTGRREEEDDEDQCALTEYLADNGSAHPSPSSDLFLYEQILSDLRITPSPSLLDTAHLIDIRYQRKRVETEVGNLEHTVRATFTETALDEHAVTTSGESFQKLQVGAIFKILACERRVSDCFDPARVNVRITSVAVIHQGIGLSQFTKNLKKVDNERSVFSKLKGYTPLRSDPMDSDCVNNGPLISQDELLTQLDYQSLKAPSPLKPGPDKPVPFVKPPVPARAPGAKLLDPKVPTGGARYALPQHLQKSPSQEPAPSSAQFVTQMPMQAEECTSSGESALAITLTAKHPAPTSQTSAGVGLGPSSKTGRQRMPMQSSTDSKSNWQERTAGARYLPRYIGIRARDQEELIKNDASWQPSLVGRHIEGQVPLHLLEEICRAADAAAEIQDLEPDDAGSDDDGEAVLPDRGSRTNVAVESGPVDLAPQQSPSSPISWDDSPPRLAQIRSLLPPDSSPLQDKEEAQATETGTRWQSRADGLRSPSAEVEQESSSPDHPAAAFSDEEELAISPARHEAAIAGATQATFLELGSDSDDDDQPDKVHASAEMSGADVKRKGESTFVAEPQLQKNSSGSAIRQATSSLNSMHSVQVSRTPAVHRQESTTTVNTDHRVDKNLERTYSYLPQLNEAQLHPSSSQFVPATYFAPPPRQATSKVNSIAAKAVPASDQHLSESVFKEEAGRTQEENTSNKRRREGSVSEMSSKRQRVEGSGGKTVPTSNDPDLWSSEMRARQGRDEFMAEERLKKERLARDKAAREREGDEKQDRDRQEEARHKKDMQEREEQDGARLDAESQEKGKQERARQERLTQKQQTHAASLLNDNLSVESRDRRLSPRSSILKHHASTPITRASDYQISNVSKDHLHYGPLRDLSVDQAGAQDVFELFRLSYPDYKGGPTQFEQACQLLHDLGNSAPRAYLNDDFVFRYNNDYMDDYLPRVFKGGKSLVPFEQFYQGVEQDDSFEPISVTKVLKPKSLSRMLKEAALREEGARLSEQISLPVSLRITSHTEARPPPVSARSEKHAVVDPVSPKQKMTAIDHEAAPKTQSQSINHSQESSIKDWLEDPQYRWKPAGAGSPELGTPPNLEKLADIPDLLEILDATPAHASKGTPRQVPWKRPENVSLPHPSTAPARAHVIPAMVSTSARKPKAMDESVDDKGKGKAAALRRRQTDFPVSNNRKVAEEEPVDFGKPFIKPRSNAEIALEDKFGTLGAQFSKMDERRGIARAPVLRAVNILSWKGGGGGKGEGREMA